MKRQDQMMFMRPAGPIGFMSGSMTATALLKA
jgi:hypothetical protein